MGTGATAAGPARPVLPRAQPITVQLAPALPRPEAFIKKQAATAAAPAIAVTPQIEKNFGWTYPMARCLAFGIDVMMSSLLAVMVAAVSSVLAGLDPWFLADPAILGISIFFLLAFCWALVTSQEVLFKTTIGKRLFGLRLRGSTRSIFARSLLFIPSFVLGGAGLLWALIDGDKRCWHDAATGLQPTRITRL